MDPGHELCEDVFTCASYASVWFVVFWPVACVKRRTISRFEVVSRLLFIISVHSNRSRLTYDGLCHVAVSKNIELVQRMEQQN